MYGDDLRCNLVIQIFASHASEQARGYVRVDKAQICCGLDIGQEGLSSVYTGVVPVSSRVQIPTHHNITGISDANTTFDAACFYKHYSREIETCFLTSQD